MDGSRGASSDFEPLGYLSHTAISLPLIHTTLGFGNNDIHSGVFDKAQREIFHQMRNGGFMEFKKHDLFEHFKQAHKRKFAQRNFVVGFQPKKEEIKEHYKLKESSLNFDEITDEDKYFDFDAHLKNKKLDAITKENIKDFEKDMQGVL